MDLIDQPLTAGIPQSSAAPDLVPAFGENPWEVEQREAEAIQSEKRQRTLDKLDGAALNPDSFFKGKDLSFARDPEKAKRDTLNSAFLRFYDGEDVPLSASDPVRGMIRAKVARELFDGRGADSEEAFHAEVVRSAQERKDSRDMRAGMIDAATQKAFLANKGNGWDERMSFAEWKQEAARKPGYIPADEPAYFDQWSRVQRAVKASVDDYRPQLDSVWQAVQTGDGVRDAAEAAYYELSEEERPRFMAALAIRARALPKEEQPAFWANLRKQSGRDIKGFGQSALDAGDRETMTDLSEWEDVPPAMREAAKEGVRALDFQADVHRIEQVDYDPMKYLAEDGSWSQVFEKAAYGAPGAVATSLAAAIPGVGMPAFYLSSQESIYQQYRQDWISKGVDPERAAEMASNLAPLAALPQVALEKLQVKAVFGKLPMTEKVLAGIGDKIASRAGRFALRTGVGAVEEGALEQVQDYVPSLVQDIGHALQSDIPDVRWTGNGGVLDGWEKATAQQVLTMLPLAILGAGGGVSKDARVKAFQAASDAQLQAIGVKDVAAVREGINRGMNSGAIAIEQATQDADAGTAEAQAARQDLQAQAARQEAAQAKLERMGFAVPRFVQDKDGIQVLDGATGEDLGRAQNLPDALAIAREHTAALDNLTGDQVAALGTMMESARAAVELDPSSKQDIALGEVFDPESASPEMQRRYFEQVSMMEEAEGGTGDLARAVLGTSETSFAQGVRETVNRLYSGSSTLTAFHETFHGLRRAALARGAITRADEIALLRSLDTIFAKSGKARRFIPDGMADDQVTEARIDEAISAIAEMEVLRTRKTEGKGKLGVSRGVVSRNLSALAKLMPGVAGKWQAFFRAVRARWGVAMSRAVALKAAERRGEFDRDGYESHLNKLLGLDAQQEHEDGVREELNRIMREPDDLEGDDIPFSLGPADVPGMLQQDVLKRISDPRRRAHMLSRMARSLSELKLEAERMVALSGRKRTKAELRAEANARQDTLEDELVGEVHVRFGDLMSNEDLTKLKSQPIHSLFANPDTPLRGRLMSKAAAIKAHPDRYRLHRAGEYDGSEGVSRSLFGGSRMPDQAAQDAFDEGLISDPTPDALWDGLIREQNTVTRMREAEGKMKEQIREAKAEAKRQTTEWLNTQEKDQETAFGAKASILRGLRLLDAILAPLPAEVRGKVGGYTQMARISTDDARLSFLKDKLAKADTVLMEWLKEQFGNEMADLLKRAAPQRNEAGQRPQGSIEADAWDVIKAASAAMTLSAAAGRAEAAKYEAIAADADTPADDAMRAQMKADLTRLMADWANAGAARREQAVMEVERIFYGGLMNLRIEQSRRRERLEQLRAAGIEGTGKSGHVNERKEANSKLGKMGWGLLSFPQVANAIFGEGNALSRWLGRRELAASNAFEDAMQAKLNAMEATLEAAAGSKFAGDKLRHRMQTERSIKVTDALGAEHLMTEAEAITFLLTWRQADGRRHMEGRKDEEGNITSGWAWNDAAAASVSKQLSRQGRMMLAHFGNSYGEEYGRINEVFRRVFHVSMPRHALYAPLTPRANASAADGMVDPLSGESTAGGMTPGSLKNRDSMAVAEIEFVDAFTVFLNHARQMEHFIAYGEFARDAMAIMRSQDIKKPVEAAAGVEGANVLNSFLEYFARGGMQKSGSWMAQSKFLSDGLGRLSAAALVGRISVLGMQGLQLGAAVYKMPLGAYVSRLARLNAGMLGWKDALQSDYIQRRIATMPVSLRDAMRGLEGRSPNRLKYEVQRIGAGAINAADAIFTAGTYAIVFDYQLKQAKESGVSNPEQFAHTETEVIVDQIAQPTRAGAKSMWELSHSDPMARMIWNFSSDPRQKAALAIYEALRGDKTAAEKRVLVARSLAITWVVGGILQATIRAALRDMRSDDDDEIFDERHWSLSRLALQAFTGPIGGIPVIGDVIEDVTYGLTGEYIPGGGITRVFADAAKLPGKWSKGNVDPLKDAEAIAMALSFGTGTGAATASILHLIRDTIGIGENIIKAVDDAM